MSFNSPFFDFFDNINSEVDAFNRLLGEGGLRSYAPGRQLVKAPTKDSTGKEVAKPNNYSGALYDPRDEALDDWFDNDLSLFSSGLGFPRSITVPVDILDHDKNYELKVVVPGVKSKKDIDIEYHQNKNQILVSGEIPSSLNEESKDKVKVKESNSGRFKRVITLPDYPGVDADNIKADYASGVLTLTVPKLKPQKDGKSHVKKIEVSSQESWGN
ncbi:hypothetical protein SKDZ_02G1770 [Saccharomyces kudriavzevii ZP591]|uniref:HSP26-like protein n=2 Tax=Saccharomyces kudriavzevii (strain ATCC MYA-4449 / AS 2.2408 / CBS 8840 / NBRC 1802 / NCYC 2889) TaxID=226230 RepID=J8TXE2_SACK1|nr:uncharacterized protein SKDI_02G1780 [Saccharomyces kudriavzevii IFO 1802]EJT44694.1 HSP26-like protein [Saccharomyces kudriavzevii IFO 1802]CAI4055348.1 hypothetical protein SKDZ_02G1770 [Saccharomyces kudriavzevii ZP591]CAI4055409.1 hypothetical protein SKDI_02G1780 [Saccharomyces kudriavzevii IFO 1802]